MKVSYIQETHCYEYKNMTQTRVRAVLFIFRQMYC